MFEQAAGFAVLAAISPPAMLIAAIFLGSERPGRMTAVYVIGGLVIVAIVATIALLVIRDAGLSHHSQQHTRYGLRLALGIVALIAAVVLARREPKKPDPAKPKKPSLIQRMSSAPNARNAFIVGILIFGPSVSFIAAVQVVATAKAGVAATVGALAMIVVITVAFAWIPLVAYLIAPDRTVRSIRATEAWVHKHGKQIVVCALAVIGVILVIQGIVGIS
jgi:MFS family permease